MEPQKQLTTQIIHYRESKQAGNIQVLAHTDLYGNITAAVEQTLFNQVTCKDSTHVLANVTADVISATLERVKTMMTKGDPNNPNDIGVERLEEQAAQFEKMALEQRAKADERKKQYGEEIANMEAMRDDIDAVIKGKEQEREEQLKATTEAIQKVADETKTTKKNA